MIIRPTLSGNLGEADSRQKSHQTRDHSQEGAESPLSTGVRRIRQSPTDKEKAVTYGVPFQVMSRR